MPVFIVAPFPPPTHGFAVISEAMARVITLHGVSRSFDMSPNGGGILLFSIFEYVKAFLTAKPHAVYLALSGGRRQALDLIYLMVARIFRVKTYLHHHSFAYINAPTLLAWLCIKLGTRHVTLCDCMADKLQHSYGLSDKAIQVISNSAFLGLARSPRITRDRDKLRVGFISNITREKGVFEFFEIIRTAANNGVVLEGKVAGPVDSTISSDFAAELAESNLVEHVGPLYGAAKQGFYDSIDVLIFPSSYVNEAEPVSVLEALMSSVPVICYSRGCLASFSDLPGCFVLAEAKGRIAQAAKVLARLSDPQLLASAKLAAGSSYTAMHSKSAASLVRLVKEIHYSRSH